MAKLITFSDGSNERVDYPEKCDIESSGVLRVTRVVDGEFVAKSYGPCAWRSVEEAPKAEHPVSRDWTE